MINKIKKIIIKKNIDGYLVSKNDEYFTEYSKISNLKLVSNFSGSAGFALIMKNKNYLFVDGRYKCVCSYSISMEVTSSFKQIGQLQNVIK